MFTRNGRFSVQFQHNDNGVWEKHQMLNSDDLTKITDAYGKAIRQVKRITCNVTGVRLVDNISGETLGEWSA